MNTVTKRFLDCFEQLKLTNKVRSGRQFAVSLDYLPQSFSEIINGRREVTVELLRKATEQYRLNPAYLLSGLEPMILPDPAPAVHNGAPAHNGFDGAPAHNGTSVPDDIQTIKEMMMQQAQAIGQIQSFMEQWAPHPSDNNQP
ncbi:MAG: hypothetical protein IAE84_03560 [Saprospiraceae bacterium]|nr:hypothetical protein [Saprospiraceae bacterium]HRD81537.1 hypothetical protein [Saprospiraceae bacterium]